MVNLYEVTGNMVRSLIGAGCINDLPTTARATGPYPATSMNVIGGAPTAEISHPTVAPMDGLQ